VFGHGTQYVLLLLQVVYALGPVAGRLPEGGFGYIDNMTPERVEAQGDCCLLSGQPQEGPSLSFGGMQWTLK
jgi:hypothetical protein